MAWTDPPDFVALQKLSAATLNALLRDDLNYLKAIADDLQGGAKVATQTFGTAPGTTLAPGDTQELELYSSPLTIPFDGFVITRLVVQVKMIAADYERVEVSAAGGGLSTPGTSWLWEASDGFHGTHGTIPCEFTASVSAGSWTPKVQVLCHSDSSGDVFINQFAGSHVLTTNLNGMMP